MIDLYIDGSCSVDCISGGLVIPIRKVLLLGIFSSWFWPNSVYIYIYEHSTCRYIRSNALNVPHVSQPRFIATFKINALKNIWENEFPFNGTMMRKKFDVSNSGSHINWRKLKMAIDLLFVIIMLLLLLLLLLQVYNGVNMRQVCLRHASSLIGVSGVLFSLVGICLFVATVSQV